MTGAAAEPGPHPIHHVLAHRLADPGGGVVVDLGCGQGRTLTALQRRWPGTRLIGIDLQPAPLTAGQPTDIGARLLLVRADLAHPLPLDGASVAALVCHNVIELLPRPAVLFAEAYRGAALRRSGRVVAHRLRQLGHPRRRPRS